MAVAVVAVKRETGNGDRAGDSVAFRLLHAAA
jgi:hypothetical protein